MFYFLFAGFSSAYYVATGRPQNAFRRCGNPAYHIGSWILDSRKEKGKEGKRKKRQEMEEKEERRGEEGKDNCVFVAYIIQERFAQQKTVHGFEVLFSSLVMTVQTVKLYIMHTSLIFIDHIHVFCFMIFGCEEKKSLPVLLFFFFYFILIHLSQFQFKC